MAGFFAHGAEDASADACGCCTTSRRGFLRTLTASAGALALPAIARAQAPAPKVAPYKIDTHFHYYPPHVQTFPGVSNPAIMAWTQQRAIEELDKNNVRTGMLSMASVPQAWFRQDTQTSRKFVRDINDYGAKMEQDNPGRFGLFTYLSMLDIEGTLKEIEYGFDTLKADGVNISTGWIDKYPGDPMFAPIFQELNRRKAVVYLHPTTQACCGGAVSRASPGSPWVLRWCWRSDRRWDWACSTVTPSVSSSPPCCAWPRCWPGRCGGCRRRCCSGRPAWWFSASTSGAGIWWRCRAGSPSARSAWC